MKRFLFVTVLILLFIVSSINAIFIKGRFLRKAAICASIGAYACSKTLTVVTSGNTYLVERFGKYHRKLQPGWHLLIPIVEQVSFRGTDREQVLDVPPQQCYTLDNAPLKADAVVYMRIFNMEAARYNIMDLHDAILNLCLTQLREEVGKLTLDESFSSRERINKALLHDLNSVCQTWGVEITRVEIQNLEPSRDILAAMELQMAAEREKRAAILHSEGERVKLLNEAEGRAGALISDAEAKKKRTVLEAQGENERLQLEAEGIRQSIDIISKAIINSHNSNNNNNNNKHPGATDAAIQMLMLTRYMDTQSKFATNGSNGTKVIMFPSKDTLPITYEGLTSLLK